MEIIILKFGGTSLADINCIKKVANIIKNRSKYCMPVIVVSAMSGSTNKLLTFCKDILEKNNENIAMEYDVAMSSGEIVSAALLSIALQSIGLSSRSLQSWQVAVNVDEFFSQARIKDIEVRNIKNLLSKGIIPVITGYYGINEFNQIATLGRGGSDTSALGIAAALGCKSCEIYTDVNGIFDIDPRYSKYASLVTTISYEECLEFSSLGAKVIHQRAVKIAMKNNIDIKILNTFDNKIGTVITNSKNIMEKTYITGIAFNKDILVVKIFSNSKDSYLNIPSKFSEKKIYIHSIHYSGNSTEIIFPLEELDRVKNCLSNIDEKISINTNLAIISIVGAGLQGDTNLISKINNIIENEKVNLVSMISSELKISMLVPEEEIDIVKKLHDQLIKK